MGIRRRYDYGRIVPKTDEFNLMHILALVRLTTLKVYDHLLPLAMNENLDHLTLVRYARMDFDHPKVSQVAPPTPPQDTAARSNILNPLKLLWWGLRAARRENPQVIYGIYYTTNGLLAWLIARLTGKKCLVSFIGTDLNKDVLEYASGPFLLWFLRRTDAITVFDEAARQKLIERGVRAERIFVMPHAVEMSRFVRRTDAPQDIDVIFTGLLIELKEVARLLDAWAKVVKKRPEARLALVGDGPLRPELEAQAARLGISENVIFTGWVDNVADYLSRAKIFVNLANQEGVPHSMIEAMACGLVPVVTDVGGVPSVIAEGANGLLLPNYPDPELVAERILSLLENPAQREAMAKAAQTVRDQHTYEAVCAAWTPVLDYLRVLSAG
jgi:glycosyltransferase involved in cell wall biosynthesis